MNFVENAKLLNAKLLNRMLKFYSKRRFPMSREEMEISYSYKILFSYMSAIPELLGWHSYTKTIFCTSTIFPFFRRRVGKRVNILREFLHGFSSCALPTNEAGQFFPQKLTVDAWIIKQIDENSKASKVEQ